VSFIQNDEYRFHLHIEYYHFLSLVCFTYEHASVLTKYLCRILDDNYNADLGGKRPERKARQPHSCPLECVMRSLSLS